MRRVLLVGLCAAIAAFSGCSSGDDSTPDAQATDVDACTNPNFRFAHGTDGHADPLGAAAAHQARAGKLTRPEDIIQAPDTRHRARLGDFVIANDKVAAYIEAENTGASPSDGYFPFGGEVLSLSPIGPDGRPQPTSYYGETVLLYGLQTVAPEKVSVLNDGSDGKAAIVRVSGTLKLVPTLDVFLALFPDQYNFPIALDYVLEPGASKITMRYSVASTRNQPVDLSGKLHLGSFQSSRSKTFMENSGYTGARGDTPYLAWDNGGASWMLRSQLGPFKSFLAVAGLEVYNSPNYALASCEKKTVDYMDLVIGGAGIDGLLETKRAAYAEPAGRVITGVLREQNGGPLAGAYVHALSAGNYLTRVQTDANGAYTLHVPPGAPVELTPTLLGWEVPPATPANADAVDLTLPQRATIEVDASDADTKEALPVRVQIIPNKTVKRAPAPFGLDDEPDDRLYREYAITGRASLPVPPGGHRVIVTRGYEYELVDQPVIVDAGQTFKVTAALKHSVDSTGVMCGDFHIHSVYSADSSDPVLKKVKGALADGLEIPVSSEHEYIIDFQPVIEQLGMQKWAFGIASEELTTFKWGHFGVFPLSVQPDAPNNGAIESTKDNPPVLFPQIAARGDQPLFIVNHPRGDTGYFDLAGFDRNTLTGSKTDLWSDVFGALEVFNDGDFEKFRDNVVADWFAFLNAGKKMPAVGSSDSHTLSTSPVGYPRTCMRFGHDDPRLLNPGVVRDTLRAGASTISGGLTMTVEGPGGITPGGTATAGQYKVVVSSPSWVVGTKLEVIIDGVTTKTIDIDPAENTASPGHRNELLVDVQPAQSRAFHWVVFHAKGDGDLKPLHPDRSAFAVSNAIFF
ncbi:MAG: CehA/McbA family metallohydrolase [Labilithrix sp.]